ncbi:hypothetical protein H4R19_002195 [Coemansia spiralis]|nr:hypothetical protein H4R19_002195 [Coemansia spiralis]
MLLRRQLLLALGGVLCIGAAAQELPGAPSACPAPVAVLDTTPATPAALATFLVDTRPPEPATDEYSAPGQQQQQQQTTEELPGAEAEEQVEPVEPEDPEEPEELKEQPDAIPEHHRRDTRALKDRFNYASSDCAAVVLKANREARGLTAILNPKKDQYMLNECAATNKHVIVELCDDILIDTLVLGNYEFFSSTFKDVVVHASDRYPPKDKQWTLIGHFQGVNSRDAQVFPVVDPKTWARYLLIEFVTHHGNEHYCPLTVLGVYGSTQMEQYRKEAEEEEELAEPATLGVDMLLGMPLLDHPLRPPHHHQPGQHHQPPRIAGSVSHAKAYLQDMQGLVSRYQGHDTDKPPPASRPAPIPRVPSLPWMQSSEAKPSGGSRHGADLEYSDEEDEYDVEEDENEDGGDDESAGSPEGDARGMVTQAVDVQQQQQQQQPPQQPQQPRPKQDGANARPASRQESIFKTIMRRLARVERNVTLAYRYLEEQHLVFNLVLQQVEMNSLETMQLAIDQLNRTTSKQMQSLTTLSEEVWRAILYDLEEYQQKTESDMGEMASRLEFLAEEVLFEKRMNVAQLVLLLTIVVMVAVNKVATRLALIPEAKKEK